MSSDTTSETVATGAGNASAPELEVRPLDGPTLKGTLVSLDGEQLKITTADGEKSVAVKELATATVTPAPTPISEKPQVWVHLTGGSVIHGTSYVLKEKKMNLLKDSKTGPSILFIFGEQIPMESL